jgi:hypothetical protein
MATRELEVVASVHRGAAAPVGGAVMALDEVLNARAVDALLAR